MKVDGFGKVGIVIQARMTSTRLPGKVLKRVLNRPLFSYQLERLKPIHGVDFLIVATTQGAEDEALVAFAEEEGVPTFRGSEHDVLGRYFGAANQFQLDHILRITSDCPLIDPSVVSRVLGVYRDAYPDVDYVSNVITRTYPRGLDVEVFSRDTLTRLHQEVVAPSDREHVTAAILKDVAVWRTRSVILEPNHRDERWTVDTVEDFELIRRILEALYPQKPDFDMFDVLSLLDRYPDWRKLNAEICQKSYK